MNEKTRQAIEKVNNEKKVLVENINIRDTSGFIGRNLTLLISMCGIDAYTKGCRSYIGFFSWIDLKSLNITSNSIHLVFKERSFTLETAELDKLIDIIKNVLQRMLLPKELEKINVQWRSSMKVSDVILRTKVFNPDASEEILHVLYNGKDEICLSEEKMYSIMDMLDALPSIRSLKIILEANSKCFTRLIKFFNENQTIVHLHLVGPLPQSFSEFIISLSNNIVTKLQCISLTESYLNEAMVSQILTFINSHEIRSVSFHNAFDGPPHLLYTKFLPSIRKKLYHINLSNSSGLLFQPLLSPRLISLNVENCGLDVVQLFEKLSLFSGHLKNLRFLNISGNFMNSSIPINSDLPEYLTTLFANSITFKKNLFSQFLSFIFIRCSRGIRLSVNNTVVQDSDWDIVEKLFTESKYSSLLQLSWECNVFSDALINFLSRNKDLTVLNCSGCFDSTSSKVFDRFCSYLSKSKINTLVCCGTDDHFLGHKTLKLIEVAGIMPELFSLDISNNMGGNDVYSSVQTLMAPTSKIKYLNIDGSSPSQMVSVETFAQSHFENRKSLFVIPPINDFNSLMSSNSEQAVRNTFELFFKDFDLGPYLSHKASIHPIYITYPEFLDRTDMRRVLAMPLASKSLSYKSVPPVAKSLMITKRSASSNHANRIVSINNSTGNVGNDRLIYHITPSQQSMVNVESGLNPYSNVVPSKSPKIFRRRKRLSYENIKAQTFDAADFGDINVEVDNSALTQKPNNAKEKDDTLNISAGVAYNMYNASDAKIQIITRKVKDNNESGFNYNSSNNARSSSYSPNFKFSTPSRIRKSKSPLIQEGYSPSVDVEDAASIEDDRSPSRERKLNEMNDKPDHGLKDSNGVNNHNLTNSGQKAKKKKSSAKVLVATNQGVTSKHNNIKTPIAKKTKKLKKSMKSSALSGSKKDKNSAPTNNSNISKRRSRSTINRKEKNKSDIINEVNTASSKRTEHVRMNKGRIFFESDNNIVSDVYDGTTDKESHSADSLTSKFQVIYVKPPKINKRKKGITKQSQSFFNSTNIILNKSPKTKKLSEILGVDIKGESDNDEPGTYNQVIFNNRLMDMTPEMFDSDSFTHTTNDSRDQIPMSKKSKLVTPCDSETPSVQFSGDENNAIESGTQHSKTNSSSSNKKSFVSQGSGQRRKRKRKVIKVTSSSSPSNELQVEGDGYKETELNLSYLDDLVSLVDTKLYVNDNKNDDITSTKDILEATPFLEFNNIVVNNEYFGCNDSNDSTDEPAVVYKQIPKWYLPIDIFQLPKNYWETNDAELNIPNIMRFIAKITPVK